MNLLLRLVLVGVARGLFEGAYYSAQITQRCAVNRGRGLIGARGLIEEIRYIYIYTYIYIYGTRLKNVIKTVRSVCVAQ